jgi:hypothetical protein
VGPTGEEIRARLQAFAARWSVYDGSERGEAQTFLNELFECYGTKRSEVAQLEAPRAGRFLDLIWPRVCLIEMKAPSEAKRLEKHRQQALAYWFDASDPEKESRFAWLDDPSTGAELEHLRDASKFGWNQTWIRRPWSSIRCFAATGGWRHTPRGSAGGGGEAIETHGKSIAIRPPCTALG